MVKSIRQKLDSKKKSICIVTASEMTVRAFLLDQLRALVEHYDLYVVTNTISPDFLRDEYDIPAWVIPLSIERTISPGRDVRSLWILWRLFRQYQFDLVHSVTPKAGLLTMLAGLLAGIPNRIHTFTGQVWVTRRGPSRWLIKSMDRILAACATHILVDSVSQRDFILARGVVSGRKSAVLATGSISGVNLERFQPRLDIRSRIRLELGIPEQAKVFLFLGRLNWDKGVLDLARAFSGVCSAEGGVHLLVVGPDESGLRREMMSRMAACGDRVHFVDFSTVPEHYMAAADLFCLPSYREGFGSVVIEAAATGIPAIGSRIYGVMDSIVDGETGFLFPAGNVKELERLMRRFVNEPGLGKRMGERAMIRAKELFACEILTQALLDYYAELLR